MAQLVKNLPAMWETWVQCRGWEDPLEKEKATHSSILAWRIPWTAVHGVAKSQTRLSDVHFPRLHHSHLPRCSASGVDYLVTAPCSSARVTAAGGSSVVSWGTGPATPGSLLI